MIRVVIEIHDPGDGRSIVHVDTQPFFHAPSTKAEMSAWQGLCEAINQEVRKHGPKGFDCTKPLGGTQ